MPTARTLSDDVYLLAGLLGEVLRAQAGQAAFDLEEEVRGLAKAFRAGEAAAGDRLEALVAGVSVEEAEVLIRAFTSYFQLINLSEDNERIRRLHRREADSAAHSEAPPRRGSLREAVGILADHGVDADGFRDLLARATADGAPRRDPIPQRHERSRSWLIVAAADCRRLARHPPVPAPDPSPGTDGASERIARDLAEPGAAQSCRGGPACPPPLPAAHVDVATKSASRYSGVSLIPQHRGSAHGMRRGWPRANRTQPVRASAGDWRGTRADKRGGPALAGPPSLAGPPPA